MKLPILMDYSFIHNRWLLNDCFFFQQELLQQCKNQIPEEKQDVGIDSEMVDSEEDENTLRRAAIISCKKNNVLNDDNCDVEEGEIIENGASSTDAYDQSIN